MNASWPNFPVLQRLHFCQTALVALGAAEMSGKTSLDQFQSESGSDHFSTQTKDIHVVIFDALMGGENIMDEPSTDAGDFVRSDGRSHATAAERHSTLHLSRGDSPGQGDDEVGVVISGVQLVCAEVHDLVPQAKQRLSHLAFQDIPSVVRGNSYAHHGCSLDLPEQVMGLLAEKEDTTRMGAVLRKAKRRHIIEGPQIRAKLDDAQACVPRA